MANFKKIQDEIANDEQVVTDIIYTKAGDPYLGPDKKPCTVSVVGSDAKTVKRAKYDQMYDALHSGNRSRGPDDVRNNRVETAKAAMRSWTGWTEDEEGTIPMPFTPDKIEEFLSADHILAQVESMIDRHARLFGKQLSA